MSDSIASSVLDSLLDPLSRCLDAESARRVAEFRVAAPERAEYDAFTNASDFVRILKLKALRNLESNQHA